MSFFSWLCVSGIRITVRYPRALPTRASPIPVLPAVPSTTTPPGWRSPRCSASRIMYFAARSLTEPPGFRNSALPSTVQPVSSDALRSRISGVLPTASVNSSRTSTGRLLRFGGREASGAADRRRVARVERQLKRERLRTVAHLAQRLHGDVQELVLGQALGDLAVLRLDEHEAQRVF